MIKLNSAEFYVLQESVNSPDAEGRVALSYRNIFDYPDVKMNVALWVAGDVPPGTDFMYWCFGGLENVTTSELCVCPRKNASDAKVINTARILNAYKLFVKKNETALRALVDSIEPASAEEWLNEQLNGVIKNEETR